MGMTQRAFPSKSGGENAEVAASGRGVEQVPRNRFSMGENALVAAYENRRGAQQSGNECILASIRETLEPFLVHAGVGRFTLRVLPPARLL